MEETQKMAEVAGQVGVKLNEIASLFQNPVLTLVVRADNLPGVNYIMTRDDVSNPIKILRDFRSAMIGRKMSIEDIVDIHKRPQ